MERHVAVMFVAAVGVVVGGIGLSTERAPLDDAAPKPEVLTGEYSKWPLANQKWFHMADHLAVMCRMPGPEHSAKNPHDKAWIKVYVNSTGAGAMRELKEAFPVGSVIVKEKREGKASEKAALYTVMTKREKGYNPGSGDWEYAVYDGKRILQEKGRIERCQSCHAGVKDRDYVFGNYRDEAFMNGRGA